MHSWNKKGASNIYSKNNHKLEWEAFELAVFILFSNFELGLIPTSFSIRKILSSHCKIPFKRAFFVLPISSNYLSIL